MRCRKVKMSTYQLARNILVFLTEGNSAIRKWQHSDLNACLQSLVFTRMCSIAGSHWHVFCWMLNSTLQDTADFVKKEKTVTCRGTKVPRVSLYRVVKNKQLVAFTDSESFYFVRCSRFAWPYKAGEERTAIKRELLYLKTQLLINLCRNRTTAFLSSFGLMVNEIDRPNTTPTVRGICKFAVYFSAFLWLHSCLWRAFRIVL